MDMLLLLWGEPLEGPLRSIKPDDVVSYMLHGLSNKHKNRIFTGMKILTQIAKFNAMGMPTGNPMQLATIGSTDAYDKFMDAQALENFCKFDKKLVPIVSHVDALANLPPVPVYYRPLPDVLTSAFMACSAPTGEFWLRPQQPSSFHPDQPPS